MRAEIVDGEVLTLVQKDSYHCIVNAKAPPLTLRDVSDSGDGVKFGQIGQGCIRRRRCHNKYPEFPVFLLRLVSEPGLAPDRRGIFLQFCTCEGACPGFEMRSGDCDFQA